MTTISPTPNGRESLHLPVFVETNTYWTASHITRPSEQPVTISSGRPTSLLSTFFLARRGRRCGARAVENTKHGGDARYRPSYLWFQQRERGGGTLPPSPTSLQYGVSGGGGSHHLPPTWREASHGGDLHA